MPGLVRGVARTAVVAGTATAVSNRVSRRQAGRWAAENQAAQLAYQSQAAPPQAYGYGAAAPAPAASDDDMSTKLDQLNQLGELRSQGVLTEAEFEAQKRRILGA